MAAHPLNRPASWQLSVGAPDARWVRWAVGGLWLMGGAVSVAWLMALTDDALAGHVDLLYLLLAWPAVAAWLYLAWRIWVRWMAGATPLTLQWHGPVVRDSDTGSAHGGFHLAEWHAPVRVRAVLSWQGWMLLSLSRAHHHAKSDLTYAWLDAREHGPTSADLFRNRSLHQLRTLLHLPPAMTTQDGGADAAARLQGMPASAPVASWAHSINPGVLLRRLAFLSRAGRPSSANATPSRMDTAFPATTVMAERRLDQHAGQTGRTHQGGRR